MPWNRTTRKDYRRDGGSYESNVTDKEWAIVEPMIPKQGCLGQEAALKDKFPTIQGPLNQRINEAAKQQKLTPELAEWAHQIRLDGNDAAHGDKPLSQKDVAEKDDAKGNTK